MYYSDYEGDGGELHYRLRKQRPDLKIQGGPYFSKLSVRADQNFQRKFPSGTKYFRTKIPVTDLSLTALVAGLKSNNLRLFTLVKTQKNCKFKFSGMIEILQAGSSFREISARIW